MTVDRYHPALVVLHWILGLLIILGEHVAEEQHWHVAVRQACFSTVVDRWR